jgi:fumarate hydratase class I
VVLDARTGDLKRWLYRDEAASEKVARAGAGGFPARSAVRLEAPVSEEQVRSLKVGDTVLISGLIHTGRDAVHHHLMSHEPPVSLEGQVLYHCGPVVLKNDGAWTIKAAGPTTSSREEPYEADIISRYGVRAVMGKGGMGPKTLAALKAHGAVYLNAIGGAAQYYARCIERVEGVDLLDLGIPEAMWHLRVKEFPAMVTMDASGASLHADIEGASAAVLKTMAAPVFA